MSWGVSEGVGLKPAGLRFLLRNIKFFSCLWVRLPSYWVWYQPSVSGSGGVVLWCSVLMTSSGGSSERCDSSSRSSMREHSFESSSRKVSLVRLHLHEVRRSREFWQLKVTVKVAVKVTVTFLSLWFFLRTPEFLCSSCRGILKPPAPLQAAPPGGRVMSWLLPTEVLIRPSAAETEGGEDGLEKALPQFEEWNQDCKL